MALRWTRELKALLTEWDVTPDKASGPGGQHRNMAETAVRRALPSRPTIAKKDNLLRVTFIEIPIVTA